MFSLPLHDILDFIAGDCTKKGFSLFVLLISWNGVTNIGGNSDELMELDKSMLILSGVINGNFLVRSSCMKPSLVVLRLQIDT